MTRQAKRRTGTAKAGRSVRPYNQRCAVRVMYSRNTVKGQWRAHGRYVARESATYQVNSKAAGFDERNESIDVAGKLDNWQKAGGERMWKLIVSPEFADRLDLKRVTCGLMTRISADLGGVPLEWVAVAHYNTGHPHVHIALRGVDAQGQPFHLNREYVKSGIRSIAENLCTQQLGYRTQLDAAEAERREVSQQRYTSLDRIINRAGKLSAGNEDDSRFFSFVQNPPRAPQSDWLRLREQHTTERLIELQKMGLAECIGPNIWRVSQDFESVLRAMQRMTDRQKTLAGHGVLMSDERLPITLLDYRKLTLVEGRILVHGEEEVGREAGRSYLMLEGTDARVHHIYYTPEMEEARSRGGLKTNSFIRLRKLFVQKHPMLEIEELGDAEEMLDHPRHLRETAKSLMKRGIIPEEDGWGGWLGRYQAALRKAAVEELAREQRTPNWTRVRERER